MWADGHGVVHHLYYGPSVGESDLRGVEYYSDCGFSPQPAGMDRQRDYSLDTLCQEYTGSGVGDFRIGCLRLAGPDGSRATDLRFVSAEAVPGKYSLPGLPAAYAAEGECETLRLKLKDKVNGLAVTLLYGVFDGADVITRSALFENEGSGTIRLDKAASACLDLPFGQWELIHFQGRHCMERLPERAPWATASRLCGRPGALPATSTTPLPSWPRRTPPRRPASAWGHAGLVGQLQD